MIVALHHYNPEKQQTTLRDVSSTCVLPIGCETHNRENTLDVTFNDGSRESYDLTTVKQVSTWQPSE